MQLKLRFRFALVCSMVWMSLVGGSTAKAALLEAGTTTLFGTAIQDITLYFNPATLQPFDVPVTLRVSGTGSFILHRDAETAGHSIKVHLEGAAFSGTDPLLGDFVFGNVGKLTGSDFTGSIDNVIQDPNDPGFATGQESSFVSGDFHIGGPSFGFEFLSPPIAGLVLYTDPATPFEFSATLYGLPPAPFILTNSGPDVLQVPIGPNPYGIPESLVIAESSNRTIVSVSVPEPSSLALLGLGGIALGVQVWRRQSKRAEVRAYPSLIVASRELKPTA